MGMGAVGAWVLSCCCVGVVPSVLLAGRVFALLFPRPSVPPAKAFYILGMGCAVLCCGDIHSSLQQEAL